MKAAAKLATSGSSGASAIACLSVGLLDAQEKKDRGLQRVSSGTVKGFDEPTIEEAGFMLGNVAQGPRRARTFKQFGINPKSTMARVQLRHDMLPDVFAPRLETLPRNFHLACAALGVQFTRAYMVGYDATVYSEEYSLTYGLRETRGVIGGPHSFDDEADKSFLIPPPREEGDPEAFISQLDYEHLSKECMTYIVKRIDRRGHVIATAMLPRPKGQPGKGPEVLKEVGIMLSAAAEGNGDKPPILVTMDALGSQLVVAKALAGIAKEPEISDAKFFCDLTFESLNLPLFPYRATMTRVGAGECREPVFGVLGPKHGIKNCGTHVRSHVHYAHFGRIPVHPAIVLRAGCPVKAWTGTDIQSDLQRYNLGCSLGI